MTRAELIALASPPCHVCSEPVQRVEARWHMDEDGCWRSMQWMLCASDHRVLMEPLDMELLGGGDIL